MSSVLQPTIGPDELVPKLAALALSPEGLTRTLARWFLEHQADAASLSISETAARAGVSEASVFRFCRSLGLAGYRELRLALMESRGLARAARMLMPDLEAREGEDGFGAIARRIVEADIEALRDTLGLVDPALLEKATEALLAASQVHLIGFGSSAPVAGDAHQRFLRLGIQASAQSDPHILAALTAAAPPTALFFGITYSGRTRDLVEALEAAGERGCTRIVLTSNPAAPVAEAADLVLASSARRMPVIDDSIATRISQLAIVEMLCVGIALRHPRRTHFVHERAFLEREIAKKRLADAPARGATPARRGSGRRTMTSSEGR